MKDTKDNGCINNNPPILERIGTYKRNIKVDIQVWNTLNGLKSTNETFNDVILGLLKQRTQSIGKKNIKLIKYHRKILFVKTEYGEEVYDRRHSVGIEFEYNDVKEHIADFALDLKIRKIFFKKQILNPSEFFGLDSDHKYLYHTYLNLYLKCVAMALEKEFRVRTGMGMIWDKDFEDIALWRKLYYDYTLSEESFINDIQEPLRLSEQDTTKAKYTADIQNSIAFSIWG